MLKKSIFTGIRWNFISSLISNINQFIKLFIFATFLTPQEFGIAAIVFVFIYFLNMFVDLGVGSAIIYFKDVKKNEINSLYWLSIFSGFSLFVFLFSLSPIIANFYQIKQLQNLIMISSVVFIISSFSYIYAVLFEKNLNFKILAISEIISSTLSTIFAYILILLNFGVYSIVLSFVLKAFIYSVIVIIYGLKYFKPSFHFSLKEIKRFLNFGIYQLGEKTINYFYSQLDILILGKILSVHEVGIYSLSKQITVKPFFFINPIISRVLFPVMAKFQDNVEQLRKLYLSTFETLTAINIPIYTLIIIYADSITYILGDKWKEATIIIQLLSVYYLLRTLINPVGIYLLSTGKVKTLFFTNIILLFLTAFFIIIGSIYGLIGICIGLICIAFLLFFGEWFLFVRKQLQIQLINQYLPAIKILIISVVSSTPILVFNLSPLAKITLFPIYIFSYMVLSYFLNKQILINLKEILWKS